MSLLLTKIRKIKIVAVALLLMTTTVVNAQTNIANYTFAAQPGIYTPITGGTVHLAQNVPYGGQFSSAITIPSFTFGGVAFTSMYISNNGFITLGSPPSTNNSSPMTNSNSATTAIITGFGGSLGFTAGNATPGANSEIQHKLVGNEYVVQYTDVKRLNSIDERISFQIRLNTVTNQINIVYGGTIVSGSSVSPLQIGIKGNTQNFANNMNNLKISKYMSVSSPALCDWSKVVTGNNTSSSCEFSTRSSNLLAPTNGLTFTWTPGTQLPVRTFSAVTAITSSGATINFTAPAGAMSYNVRYRISGDCDWTLATGNPYTSNSIPLTNLASATNYQVQVQAIGAGTATSIWSHIPNSSGTGDGQILVGTFLTAATGCDGPSTISVNAITNNGATISWNPPATTPANGYEYYVSTSPLNPLSTAIPTGTSPTATSSLVIGGLPPATAHSVWVRAACSSTAKSNWTSAYNFTTLPCNGTVSLGNDTTICVGDTLPLNIGTQWLASTPAVSWSGSSSTAQTLYVNTAGTYSVTVTDGSCVYTDQIVVAVSPPPIVDLGPDTLVCNGAPYTLSVAVSPGNSYIWTGSSSTFNNTFTVNTSGTYDVKVTNRFGCTAVDTVEVIISNLPSASGITSTSINTNTYSFVANNPENVATYTWNFGDGSAESNTPNPTHSYTQTNVNQIYNVTLVISNDCGSDTIRTTITIPGSTNINKIKLDANALKLYPNPTANSFTIENSSIYKVKQLTITNILGQEVMRIALDHNKQIVDVTHLNSGLYNVSIEFEDGIVNKKLNIFK